MEQDTDFFICLDCEAYSGNFSGLKNHLRFSCSMSEEQIKLLLLEYLKSIEKEIGHTPTASFIDENGQVTSTTYFSYFDSWNEAIKKANLDTNVEFDITDEELKENLINLSEELGRSPTVRDIWKKGQYSIKPYQNRFGTINKAKKEFGLKFNKQWDNKGENNPMYGQSEKSAFYNKGGEEHPAYVHGNGSVSYYGPFWDRIAQEVRERDGYECRICNISKDGCEHNKSLDVHHIKPQYQFTKEDGGIDYRRSNKKDNLITLCKSCHISIEGEYTDCSTPEEFVREVNDE